MNHEKKVNRQSLSKINEYNWFHIFIKTCYLSIGISFLILLTSTIYLESIYIIEDSRIYWLQRVWIPIFLMLFFATIFRFFILKTKLTIRRKEQLSIFLVLILCTILCCQNKYNIVLFALFILPIMVSALYSDLVLARWAYVFSQLLMFFCGVWRYFIFDARIDAFFLVEILTAAGLLLGTYLFTKVLIVSGGDILSRLSKAERDTEDLELELKHDVLTGLYNRRAYNGWFNRVLEQAENNKTTLSLAIFDIDDFKIINDKYGHTAGDNALQLFSKVLLKFVNEKITVFRLGGEEFLVVFQEYSLDEAYQLCNEMQQMLQAQVIDTATEHQITFSGGIADNSKGVDTAQSLFEKADEALYLAKKNGKNQIVIAKSE